MADTPENQVAFPQPASQKPGLGFPIIRLLGLFCLSSGAVLDAATSAYQGKGNDEQTLLRSLLDRLEPGSVLIGTATGTPNILGFSYVNCQRFPTDTCVD